MADVLLSTMRTQALREADAEGHLDMAVTADKDRVTDYVNAGLEGLHDLLTSAFEDYQMTVSAGFTISAGNNAVNLATALSISNVLKIRFVEYFPSGVAGTGDAIDVEPMNVSERNRYSGPRAYIIRGTSGGAATLHVYPAADSPGTYRLWYTPSFTALVNDADVFDSVNGWHRFAVLEAAIRLKGDMEKDASRLVDRKGAMEARIRAAASRRVSGRPAKVRKVRKTMAEWARDWMDPEHWQ